MKRGLVGLLVVLFSVGFGQTLSKNTTLGDILALDTNHYQAPPQNQSQPVGRVIAENFDNLSAWDQRGSTATWSVSGGCLNVSSNATIHNSLISKLNVMQPDKYQYGYDVIVGSIISGSESGVGMGMRVPIGWTGGQHNLGIQVGMDADAGRNGHIYINYDYNGTIIFARRKSEQRLSTVVENDTLRHTVTVLTNQITVVVSKIKKEKIAESISYLYQIGSDIPYKYPYLPTSFKLSINAYGGAHKVKNVWFDILDHKGSIGIIGTSRQKGTAIGTKFSDREGDVLQNLVSENIVTYASPSGKFASIDTAIVRLYEFEKILLADPANDIEAVLDINDFFNNVYIPKVNELIGLGYVLGETAFLGSPFPRNDIDYRPFRTKLYEVYGHIPNAIIDVWDIGHNKATSYGVLASKALDGVHESALACAEKANLYVDAMKLTRKPAPTFSESKPTYSLIPISYMVTSPTMNTGFTARKLIWQQCIEDGTFQAGDRVQISVEIATSGTSGAKNFWLSANPTERIIGNDYSDTTYDLLLRGTTTVAQRHPIERVLNIVSLTSQTIQSKASGATHNLVDGSLTVLNYPMNQRVCIQGYGSLTTSTDAIGINSIYLEIKRK